MTQSKPVNVYDTVQNECSVVISVLFVRLINSAVFRYWIRRFRDILSYIVDFRQVFSSFLRTKDQSKTN